MHVFTQWLILILAVTFSPCRAAAEATAAAPALATVTASAGSAAEVGAPTAVPADTPQSAQPAASDKPSEIVESFKILLQIFLLAVILEQALSVIFNWRPFLENFNARGVKTIVTVAVAWWAVAVLDLDLVARLLKSYGIDQGAGTAATELLTVFTLAGGSAGVNNLLIALGFRSRRTPEQVVAKPPKTEAWVAVRLVRDKAVGSVTASIGPTGAVLPVVGIIEGTSPRSTLLRYFVVDRGRFPRVAGHSIVPQSGQEYVVQLAGRDSSGQPLSATWGPHAIAPGAIIDIELQL